ncbi:hypothetical protein DSM104440_01241 [Usitatibacter palustris]|uniref:NADP-dependent oxidoreductase domain-containing protein n=2 Tax=Usitatibacter palustris TaxID=2732487 RepID=A0A6M4H5J7_9PROT|nr:hypothetical protein DSM104440_01241 [Usitatibacter palustris]
MGEAAGARAAEVAALRQGLDLGMTLVDTAEMYGEGGAEEVVGEAIRGRRDEVFLVSKFYPHNASRRRVPAACEASLGRLGVEQIDLYLLHWRGGVPLEETAEALERLVAHGKIRSWGVSNFDVSDLEGLGEAPVAANQVLYNLERRGIEFDLLPWSRKRHIPTMAYSPVEQGRLAKHRGLVALARSLGTTAAQVALAWLLRQPDILVIPKASNPEHVKLNRAALDITLDAQALAELDRLFPAPTRKSSLEMI